jgi:hypothetical protein
MRFLSTHASKVTPRVAADRQRPVQNPAATSININIKKEGVAGLPPREGVAGLPPRDITMGGCRSRGQRTGTNFMPLVTEWLQVVYRLN